MLSPRKTVFCFPLVFLVLLQQYSNGGHSLYPSASSSCVPSSDGGQSFPRSANCKRFECVPYIVIYNEEDDFEIRKYEHSLWMSAPTITRDDYKSAASEGFLMLLRYFNGNNKNGTIINMTIPVLIDVQNSSYTVRFYMPEKYQNGSTSLPKPLSYGIKPTRVPEYKAAVRRFGGNITNEVIPKEVAALNASLWQTPYKAAAVAAAAHRYTIAAYNSPFETEDRVNEVWFIYN